jgi:4-hydroxy-2-oxoheptanedioate aldolase
MHDTAHSIGMRGVIRRSPLSAAIVGMLSIALFVSFSELSAQQSASYVHLNPIVTKLAAGEPIIGTNTDDFSGPNCRRLARANFDFVYLDMEHGVLDLKDMALCATYMVDKEEALKRGNPSVKVALIARFAPYGRDMDGNEWIAKQALDQGLMGVIFNGTDNAEQARRMVALMRYPQMQTSKYPEPAGTRGEDGVDAAFVWGVSFDEYHQRADVWPLNPKGDLVCIPMIETLEGLKNVDAIAAVPGIAGLFIGVGGDLHRYLGVPIDSPEVEAARQKILAACKAHNIACGITTNSKAETEMRLKEGWKMIRTIEGGQP